MPIVLDPADWDTWLDEGARPRELRPLMRPFPATELLLYPVSPAVNNVRSEGAELLLPLTRWVTTEAGAKA
jgi:putative SOS response-associated peptidase YedK